MQRQTDAHKGRNVQTITEKDFVQAEARLKEATGLVRAGQERKAQKILSGLISRYPDYVAALFELAMEWAWYCKIGAMK